jgi:DNA polymerase-3 subunit gamma/tau
MSYVVLARKYRPRRFSEMVGQQHVVQALSHALTTQRLHHAYLFTGTRGVGKTTVSRILAKSLNCTGVDGNGGITAQPCGVCPACRDIDAGRYVDYVELDAASNRGVDEISQLLDQAVYKPVVGRFKVYMIDEVHMLTTTAFNAMLKTLEEPPEYLKFVLATTDPQKVPVTVLSRCLQFNLRPMAPETVFEHLQTVLAAEAIEADAGSLRLLARAARGSMRDALSLTDQAIAFGAGRLEEGAIRQMLGAVDRGHVVRILEAVAAGDGVALVRTADELRALGLSAAGTLEELATLAQQMAVLQAVPSAVDPLDPDAATVQRMAGLLAPDETQLIYSVALHGRAELALAPDEYSGLVMVLLRLLAFKPFGDGAGLPKASRDVAAMPSPAPAPVPAAAVAPAAAKPAPTPAAVSQDLRRPALPSARVAVPVSPAPVVQSPVAARPAYRVPAPVSTPVPSPAPVAMPVPEAAASPRPVPAAVARPAPAPVIRPVSAPAADSSSAPPWADWDEEDTSLPARSPGATAAPARLADDAEVSAASMPAPGPVTGPVSGPVSGAEVDPVHVACTDRWLACCEQWFERNVLFGLVRELAWQAQCIAIDEQADPPRWTLRVERESLRQGSHRDRLQEALSELLGRPAALDIVAGVVSDSAARRDAAAKAYAQEEAESIIRNDPLVTELLARFAGARIVPGSIRPA